MPFFCPKGGPLQNPYKLLGVEYGNCTDEEITKNFKKIMLRLHPDKQPPNQSLEEAEAVSRKFHDVMDARSFLLDGEHVAARRAYDSKLAQEKPDPLAKLASLIPPKQQQQQQSHHHHQQQQPQHKQQQTGISKSGPTSNLRKNNEAAVGVGTPSSSASSPSPSSSSSSIPKRNNNNSSADKQQRSNNSNKISKQKSQQKSQKHNQQHNHNHGGNNIFTPRSESTTTTTKVKPASYAKKNNVNVKQWGRPKRTNNNNNNNNNNRSNGSAHRRRSSDGENNPGRSSNSNNNNGAAKKSNSNNNHATSSSSSNKNNTTDPMKNKMHARARNNHHRQQQQQQQQQHQQHQQQRGFEDSCGDCSTTSTTDECSSTSDDDKQRKHQKQQQEKQNQHQHQQQHQQQHHTYSKRTHGAHSNHVTHTKPSSNRPTRNASNKNKGVVVGRNHDNGRVTAPRREFSGPSKGRSVSEHTKQRNNDRGAPPRESRHHLSDTEVNNNNNHNNNHNNNKSKDSNNNSNPPPKSGCQSTNAPKAATTTTKTTTTKTTTDYSAFVPAVDTLEKQYHCPLTRQIMTEPMSDFEGNSYERHAILKYLETRSTSPVTGNPLYSMHLSPNSALKQKILYTLKLKDCIDSLQNSAAPPLPSAPEQHAQNFQSPTPPLPTPKDPQPQPHHHRETKYTSLREAVNGFIKDLNSNSPTITIGPLDNNTGITSFTYLGLKFFLEVPDCVDNDQIVVQTRFDHQDHSSSSRGGKSASATSSKVVSSKVASFNAALHKIGLGGCKLTYRNMMSGKHAFTLAKKMHAEEKFSKTTLRHGIEYFVEMSIKLHNIIHSADAMRVVEKVRLTNGSGVAAAAAGQ